MYFAFTMEGKTFFLSLIMTFSLVDRTFSAFWWTYSSQYSVPVNDYDISRSASHHRGVFLTYSASQKSEICVDLIKSQGGDVNEPTTGEGESTSELVISDAARYEGDHRYPLFVERITAVRPFRIDTRDIFFRCGGVKYLYDESDGPGRIFISFILSSAFRFGWMYSSFSFGDESNTPAKRGMVIKGYVGMSPDYIELDQKELERRYMTIRQTMSILAGESSEYVQLIEKKDDLSQLSAHQKFLLCFSIVGSPTYRKEGITSYDQDTFRYVEKPLSFKNGEYGPGKWTSDCITCEAYANDKLINVFLTRSFSDTDSVITLHEENEKFYIHKSFKNISILINVHDPATEGYTLDN